MNYFLRMTVSGFFGFIVVAGLFLMMLGWLSNEQPPLTISDAKIEFKKFIPPKIETPELNTFSLKKQQQGKPSLQSAPNLELTATGLFESGDFGNAITDSVGTKYGDQLGVSDGTSNGTSLLNTDYMVKYYHHNFKYPKKARLAGVTQGTLVAKAVFSKSHDFVRFEIIEEQPVDYFRDILYQMKFIKGMLSYNLYHPSYNVQKKIPKDVESEYYSTYKFNFDLNSDQPIRFYTSNPK